VQKALEDQGIEYEIVKEPALPRSRRKDVIRMSGQQMLPVVEFEDGSAYRAESKEMAADINAGKLFDHAAGSAGSSAAPASTP
jgi:hypothetical protein